MIALGFGSGILGLVGLIVAILVIYDIWTNQRKMSTAMKVVWTILSLVLGINIIVGIVYYFLVYKK